MECEQCATLSAMTAVFPSHEGCLVKMDALVPAQVGTAVYLAADDLEATLARVESADGKIAMKITEIVGGHGWFAVIEDSEGNHVGLHKNP